MSLEYYHYIGLFLVAALAGFIDSIAGGGGVLTIPALMTVGFPAPIALGTNKLGACFGSFTAAYRYAKRGLMDARKMRAVILCTALGAVCGTSAVQWIRTDILQNLVIGLLVVLFFFTCFTPDFGKEHRPHRLPYRTFAIFFGLGIGFYDGLFGPGTGTLWTVAFVLVAGMDLKIATGHTKVVNLTSNLVALAIFLLHRQVDISIGILMGVGQALGAYLGSHLVLTRGVRFIRYFFLLVVALTLTRLIVKTYGGG